ncbi:MAG: DUF4960 domain-containing protein, partial [Anaerovoracaceae bacterium]
MYGTQTTYGQEYMNVQKKNSHIVSDVNQNPFKTEGIISVHTGNALIESPTSVSVITKVVFSGKTAANLSGGIFYGTSPEKMKQKKGVPVEENQEWKVTLDDLQAGERYYYQSYVIVDGIIHYGDLSFFKMDTEKQETSGVAFLSPYVSPAEIVEKGDDDEASAWLWFHQEYPDGQFLYAGNITSTADLQTYNVLFYIRDLDSGSEDDVWTQPSGIQQATPFVREWYKQGGNLVLWQHAVTYITDLGRISKE